ncbi:hypothetical protein [Paraburkholderia hospita]|uniref:hypothetical protein n=1 Tax=Paraburkholderia hospita TaxID=169430 RepID=UPI0008A7E804|nr:hypothetical protein [Paraburkholderia hospita]SEI19118.1 hypothetical protein SAMN05192544_103395 [Paraburkholderia hospita]
MNHPKSSQAQEHMHRDSNPANETYQRSYLSALKEPTVSLAATQTIDPMSRRPRF